MWIIEELRTQPVEKSFFYAGSDLHRDVEVLTDSSSLINILGLANLDEDPAQVVLCDFCGTVGCHFGGWVSFRRLGDLLVLLPAFDKMRAGPWELDFYAPPEYFDDRGVPAIRKGALKVLRKADKRFPPFESLRPMSVGEVLRVIQFEAPGDVLGLFPETPEFKREQMLASAGGNLDEEVDRVQHALSTHVTSNDAAKLASDECQDIEFVLDEPAFHCWVAFAENESGVQAVLSPGVRIPLIGSAAI